MLAALALAACGALPRPFAPDATEPARGDAMRPADGGGIVVAAPEGVGEGAADLAEAVAAALRRLDIPAGTGGGNRASLRLAGTAGDGAVRWTLYRPDGAPLGAFEQPADAAAGEETARRVARLLGGGADAARAADAPGTPGAPAMPELIVPPVAGAPGDGATSLSGAMALALGEGGATLAREPVGDTLLVLGSVVVSPLDLARERVEVLWEVIESDGRRLGVVSQRNTVAKGALDGRWGAVAAAIAAGGAGGVLDLVGRVKGRCPPGAPGGAPARRKGVYSKSQLC